MSVYLYLSHNLRKILQHTSLGSLSSPFSLRHSPTRPPPPRSAFPRPTPILAPCWLRCFHVLTRVALSARLHLCNSLSHLARVIHTDTPASLCACVCALFFYFSLYLFFSFSVFLHALFRSGWNVYGEGGLHCCLASVCRRVLRPVSCILFGWLAPSVSSCWYIYTADYIYRRISMWIFSSQLEFYLALPRSLFVAIFPQIFLTIFFFLYFCIAFLSTAWLPRFWCGICIYKMKDKFFMSHKEFQYL